MRDIHLLKKTLIVGIAVLFIGLGTTPLHARGGGGCLVQGTPVQTPSGTIPIEKLSQGDTVLGVIDNTAVPVTVQSVMQIQPEDYYEIIVDGHSLAVTAEHPVQIKPGIFRMASFLRLKDTVIIRSQDGLKTAAIESIELIRTDSPAYNLLVAPAGTYIANTIVVHNKGCFLPETPIRRADGSEISISRIKRHDRLLAFNPDGQVVQTTVRKVLTHNVDEYCVVQAGNIVLHVTKEHPFYVGNGEFRTLEALKIGDRIVIFDGEVLGSQHIESIKTVHAKTRVYNLQTDAPNTFFANGAAVHNKGGGCFPAGTLIRTPSGAFAIERIKPGNTVIAVDRNGQAVMSQVKETHTTRSPLLAIKTRTSTLKTTREHPLALAAGGFRPAGELSPGDEILTWDDNQARADTVVDKSYSEIQEAVYNLTVDWPHTFIADGFIAHNKGGGGSHGGGGFHGRSGSSNSDDTVQHIILFIIIFGCIYYFVV